MDKKTYLFISNVNFASGKLTGAHRRFLELIVEIAKNSNVILVSHKIPQLDGVENIFSYHFELKKNKLIPTHIKGMIEICRILNKYKREIKYDYAMAFGQVNAVCYWLCGYKNIISLFREDLIGYLHAVHAGKGRVLYFQLLERIAVCASEKIIVQCANDKKSLISRNKRYCKNIATKIYIQINNANASWMNPCNIEKREKNGIPIILFIGNFSDVRKGHAILLPAIAKLLEENIRIKLLLAGDGNELSKYEKLYVEYEEIKFLGRVNNIEKYLEQADFLIVPSLIDSCPNTVLEGLNAGIAVYGANAGGIPELLAEQRYLFEPTIEDIYSFVKRVVLEKRYIEDSIKQNARKVALTFNWADKIRHIVET